MKKLVLILPLLLSGCCVAQSFVMLYGNGEATPESRLSVASTYQYLCARGYITISPSFR
jgi:hypothetical protein